MRALIFRDAAMDRACAEPAPIDFDHFARQTFFDRALQRELLDLFERQCAALLPAIVRPGPLDRRLAAVHALKGSALAIGAGRVAALAGQAETALARGGEAGAASALMDELAAATRAARAAARRALRKREALAIGRGLP